MRIESLIQRVGKLLVSRSESKRRNGKEIELMNHILHRHDGSREVYYWLMHPLSCLGKPLLNL